MSCRKLEMTTTCSVSAVGSISDHHECARFRQALPRAVIVQKMTMPHNPRSTKRKLRMITAFIAPSCSRS